MTWWRSLTEHQRTRIIDDIFNAAFFGLGLLTGAFVTARNCGLL